jgi:glycyl-tRNA synthetase alpha chain
MFLNDIRNIFDIPWNEQVTYGEVRRFEEVEHSGYAFEEADVPFHREQFERWEIEAGRLLERKPDGEGGEPHSAPLVLPAYEATLKCSHIFNVLDARGAFSVTERAAHIQRIRRLACRTAAAYLAQREAAGFPLLARGEKGSPR